MRGEGDLRRIDYKATKLAFGINQVNHEPKRSSWHSAGAPRASRHTLVRQADRWSHSSHCLPSFLPPILAAVGSRGKPLFSLSSILPLSPSVPPYLSPHDRPAADGA